MRTREFWVAAAVLAIAAIGPAAATAQAPLSNAFTYQGQLKDAGVPHPGPTVDLEFKLFDAETGGTELDSDTRLGVPIADGLFTTEVLFDAVEAYTGEARWLEIWADGTQLSPRQPLTAAPFALYALNGAGGPGACLWDESGSDIYYSDGRVGIGTNDPRASLHVAGHARFGGTSMGGGGDDGDYLGIEAEPNQVDWATLRFDQAELRFWNPNGGELMRLMKDGNVGIGITDPDTLLSVGGDIALPFGGEIRTTYTEHEARTILKTGWNAEVGDHLDLYTPSGSQPEVPRVRITAWNRVGIGTLTPEATLDVNGDMTVRNYLWKTGPGDFVIQDTNGVSEREAHFYNLDGMLTIRSDLNADVDEAGEVRILAASVGIGTSSPGDKLAVAGTVHSTTGGFKLPDGTIVDDASDLGGAGGASTLDEAYDGGGAGAGRTITADAGAVEILGPDGLTVAGTIQAGNSITIDGTADRISSTGDLELHVSSGRALRIEPDATSPNIIGGHGVNSVTGGVHGATIGGGGNSTWPNTVDGNYGTVGGGRGNDVGGYATVGGGLVNDATGEHATIGGGWANDATGDCATVPGGRDNEAGGYYSFAAGYRAKVRDPNEVGDTDGDQGTFVWADSTDADFVSTGPDQFLIRASGGVGIGTASPTSPLTVDGMIESLTAGFKLPDGTIVDDAGDLGGGPSLWTDAGGDIYYDGGNVGVGAPSPLATFHVRESDLAMTAGVLENDDLIIESLDAAIGLYSCDDGTWGSAIAMKDLQADGTLNDTWGIARKSTTGGSSLHITYGTSDNYAGNPTQIAVSTGGDVGIGTTEPSAKLHVSGDSNTFVKVYAPESDLAGIVFGKPGDTFHAGASCDNTTKDLSLFSWWGAIRFHTNIYQPMTITSGAVDIGTTTHGARLDVNGVARVRGDGWPASGAGMELAYSESAHKGYIQVYDRNESTWGVLHLTGETVLDPAGEGSVAVREAPDLVAPEMVMDGPHELLRVRRGLEIWPNDARNKAGYFDVRDTAGIKRVSVYGDGSGAAGEISLYMSIDPNDPNDPTAVIETVEIIGAEGAYNNGGQIVLRNSSGTTTIELDAEYGTGGSGRIRTNVLEITGGSDLSERFDIAASGDEPQPGMVVCIDPESPGRLVVSTKAYDRTVAGVISGAGGVQTGMLMGQENSAADGEHPVALTGRVYVHCNTSNGSIQPGDLLTTSNTPGHAMRVTNHSRAQGAIIGKAMTALEEGEGLVLVLVTLQ